MLKSKFFNKASNEDVLPKNIPPMPEPPAKANIVSAIQDEHKYTLMMVSVLKEQLAEYDIGKTPDYNLMYDIIMYMSDFPTKFNQPLKVKLITLVINKSPENSQDLENILAEKRQIIDFNKQVLLALKGIIKSHSILKEEELKIFAKNYVELIETHIDIERKVLFTRIETLLTSEDLAEFDKSDKADIQHLFEQDIAQLFEDKYQDISDEMNKRWEEIEDVANEFALAEFVSLGALFESIEPLTLSASEISAIIKECSYNMMMANRKCYKDLFFNQQDQSTSYLEKPISTALNCYEEYVDGMSKIGIVLKRAKTQIYEPYESRKDFFSSIENVDFVDTAKPKATKSSTKKEDASTPKKTSSKAASEKTKVQTIKKKNIKSSAA